MSTINSQVLLASSSPIRKEMIKKNFKNFCFVKHSVDEEKLKKKYKQLEYEQLVLKLSEEKANSIMNAGKGNFIIGSDQILICKNKLLSKPLTLKGAKKNLEFLMGKTHTLISAIFVKKDGAEFFKEVKKATLYFNKLKVEVLDKYIKENKETVLNTVGSYKIEDNQKYNFIKIIEGEFETILGFPLKNFLRKYLG